MPNFSYDSGAQVNPNIIIYKKRSFQRGFSLIDLLIVLLIIGVIGTILAPQLHSILNEAKLNGAASELISAMEYTKSLAIKYQRRFMFRAYRYDHTDDKANGFVVKDTISTLDNAIHLDADPPLFYYKRVFHPIDKKPYFIDFDRVAAAFEGIIEPKYEYEGVKIQSVPDGGTYKSLFFYPDGHSSDTDSSFILDLNGEQRTITVDGITGNIAVH